MSERFPDEPKQCAWTWEVLNCRYLTGCGRLSDRNTDFCGHCGGRVVSAYQKHMKVKASDGEPAMSNTRTEDCASGLHEYCTPCECACHKGQACAWAVDEDGIWHTECGREFTFIDDGPRENRFSFCCYCGGELVSPR